MFEWIREIWVEYRMNDRYEIRHAQGDEVLSIKEIIVHDMLIQLQETPTNQKAPLTWRDREEQLPQGDIVKIQWYVNGSPISQPDEIWTSMDERNNIFFGWFDVLIVKDKRDNHEFVYIVQRLTEREYELPDKHQKWKLISIDQNLNIKEGQFSYQERQNHPLWVKLTNFSHTARTVMGYYSDTPYAYGFGGIIVPGIFPLFFFFLGTFFLFTVIILIILRVMKKRKIN
jgi:hypothetical protein